MRIEWKWTARDVDDLDVDDRDVDYRNVDYRDVDDRDVGKIESKIQR